MELWLKLNFIQLKICHIDLKDLAAGSSPRSDVDERGTKKASKDLMIV